MNKIKSGMRSGMVSAREKALNILLYRMRSEKELYTKLRENGYSEEECQDAIEYVKHYGYVDDSTYAGQYVSSRGKSKGRHALRRELHEKGIADDIIECALEDLPDSDEVIMDLLIKKSGEPHRLDEKEYRRDYAYLMRRGFEPASVIRILNEYKRQAEEGME